MLTPQNQNPVAVTSNLTSIATFTAPIVASNKPVTFTLTAADNTNLNDPDGTDAQVVTIMPEAVSGADPTFVPNEKNRFGCSISPQPVTLSQRGEWWLLAGFLTWLGVFRKQSTGNSKK